MGKSFINLNLQAISLEFDDSKERDKAYAEILKLFKKLGIATIGLKKAKEKWRHDKWQAEEEEE